MKQRTVANESARTASAFLQATVAHQQGRPFQADALCAEVLRADSRHYGAWHLRGLLALEAGDTEQGIAWIEKSLKLQPNQAAAHSNIGNALLSSGRPEQALIRFERALRLKPDYLVAVYNRANALRELKRLDAALAAYDEVLRVKSDHVQALNNKGLVLIELEKLEEALAACSRAAALDSRFLPAQENVGAILVKMGRAEEALATYDSLVRQMAKNVAALTGRGNALLALGRLDEALESYNRALEINAADADALINRGHVLQSLRQPAAALEDYEHALRIAPGSALALNNSGNALLELGRAQEALARYDRALELVPDRADTLYNRGAALRELRRYAESAQCFARLLTIAPSHDYALGNLFHLKMDCCDWSQFDSLSQQLFQALASRKRVINPLSLLLSDSAGLQLACAQAFVEDKYPENRSLGPCVARPLAGSPRRLRVAYVSADFREHPVSYLLAGVIEQHDRSNVEVIGVSLAPGDGSAFEHRIRSAFDRFEDVKDRSDREVAQLMRELEVDVAVDLMGFTQGLRLGIFAHRCAPVQVSYLGYAGTTGAPYMDYLLADEVVIPTGQERHYSERVVRLPHSYLPNDRLREIGPVPTRAAAGLPPTGFVFCAFTNAYKINPPIFDVWMSLLREVPGSVLWLRAVVADARENLRREARARGVDADRLVFAPHVSSMAEHLARHALADLFLDTLPYNAHSTACDSLWAGVPVLTCPGESFASRVAASALTAVGLPELIAQSLADYERKALELARSPARFQELRLMLEQQRTSSPLFDTVRHCRELELAYRSMHELAAPTKS
jgi:predicted O-linked N-acetylglucosamine transferase (SPINDLY family)